MSENADARNMKATSGARTPAPELSYRPPVPTRAPEPIALIGCGGIARHHLDAYRSRKFPVTILCDVNLQAARTLRDEFFPDAGISDSAESVLKDASIGVVDLALHPDHRLPLMRMAVEAGKHVLSQKPFVTDLGAGRELADLADAKNVKLAVNQNGRWAPYYSYLREAVRTGLLGEIVSCDVDIAWDHSWIKGTRFEEIHHIILYDFAIHWFDITRCVFGERRALQVYSQLQKASGQDIDPPLCAQTLVQFDGGQASLVFRAHTKFSPEESTVVTGTGGTYRTSGPVCANNRITLATEAGEAEAHLEGTWFNDGFAGAMGELLCAIEEDREPVNSARQNLPSLELCLAAVASADSGQPEIPGTVTRLFKEYPR